MPTTRSHATRPKPKAVPTIELGEGDTLNIVFDSNAITPAWMRDGDIASESFDPLAMSRMLAAVILEWDFVEDDGSPIPINAEELAGFSFPVQNLLFKQILETATPSSEEGKDFGTDTRPQPPASMGDSDSSPNGQTTSRSPESSASPSPT